MTRALAEAALPDEASAILADFFSTTAAFVRNLDE